MQLIKNKRATYDYEITDKITAGLVLTGAEVKSLRLKQASLSGSFVQIVENKPILLNATISPYKYANNQDYDPKRTRQLLLKKTEIYKLQEKAKQKNYSLVPLSVETAGKKIKLIIGVGRGKKQFEKREKIKERDLAREEKRDY